MVTQHPLPQLNVDPGSNASFSLEADGSSNYHWQFNDAPLSNNPLKYVGSRHRTLTILGVEKSDEGLYSCIVGNRILSVLTDKARLTLCKCVYATVSGPSARFAI